MGKIVIIGAGPAGIVAGNELLGKTADKEVVILEAGSMAGGISKTVCVNGNRMDMGGHRFFSKNEVIMNWWKDILPVQGKPSYDDKKLKRNCKLANDGPDPETQDDVLLIRNRVSRIYYKGKFFEYPVKMNLNTVRNLGIATTICAGLSYIHALLFPRKEKSLEDFYINRFGKNLYETFFEGYTEKLWGRHPKDISPDWGAQRVKGLSITAVIKDVLKKLFHIENNKKETSLIETFYYPKYGPGQLWEKAADNFIQNGGNILFNCRVEKIVLENSKVKEVIYKNNGKECHMDVDALFSSMPVKDLAESMTDIPDKMKKIANGLPYRDFVTVGILVDKLLLKNKTKIQTLGDIVPDCWIYVQDKGIKMGRIQIFNNWSPYMLNDPEHNVWIGLEYFCNEGDDMWNMDEKAWMEFSRKELIKMNILDPDTQVKEYHCEKVPKAYPAYFDTYSQMDELKNWLMTIGNLYCIGRNGQHRYNNMDHSMLTAMEAVKAFLNPDYDRTIIWEVNTEKEYHEEQGK